jgi:phospholipid-translocating ATPase
MFRLCRQPSYWTTVFVSFSFCLMFFFSSAMTHFISAKQILMTLQIRLQLIVAVGMGPILSLKYFRYTYRPSKINTLQQAERLGGPILSLGSIEPQARSLEKDVSPLSITQPKNRNPVYEPLLSDSPNTRRSFGSGTPFDFFQSQSRLSLSYTRNCKDN